MDGDRIVEVPFGRSHADGDGESLQHFVGTQAEDVATDDAFLFPYGNELHRRLALVAGESVVHGVELGPVDRDRIAMKRARLGLGQADGADGGWVKITVGMSE